MVGFRGNSCPQGTTSTAATSTTTATPWYLLLTILGGSDEFLLESIYRSNPTADKPNSVLRIYDARYARKHPHPRWCSVCQ